MSQVPLTAEEKTTLRQRHKHSRDVRERGRINAVLLRAKGWSSSQIAEALLLDESSIRRPVQDDVSGQKLDIASGGSREKSSESQTEALIAPLTEYLYEHNHQLVVYITSPVGVEYTVSGLHNWLHRHGVVYKQPKGVPGKADVEQPRACIEKYVGVTSSVGPDEPILLGDGVHPPRATKLTYGWIKKGTDKAVTTTARRTRGNLVGAIESGVLSKTITATCDSITAEAIVDVMSQ